MVAALAQSYSGVKKWAENWFYYLEPVVTAPWFVALSILAICGYIAAIIWTGQEQSADIITQDALDREARLQAQKRRRDLIADCRDLAFRFTRETPGESFREFLEGERAYADIRSHLSAEFLAKLNAIRTTYSNADGARYPTLVGWFLDDLDRLEKEWEL